LASCDAVSERFAKQLFIRTIDDSTDINTKYGTIQLIAFDEENNPVTEGVSWWIIDSTKSSGLASISNTGLLSAYIDGKVSVYCSKNGYTKSDPITINISNQLTVYSAGYYFSNEVGKWIPCYWINKTKYDLPTPDYANLGGKANSIFIYNDSIYISGEWIAASGNEFINPCYWIDGVYHELPSSDGTFPSENIGTCRGFTKGIYVYNNSVYILGVLYVPDPAYWEYNIIAGYWKDEQFVSLTFPPDKIESGKLTPLYKKVGSIYIDEKNIIIGGYYCIFESPKGYISYPSCWKNGIRTEYTINDERHTPTTFDVSDTYFLFATTQTGSSTTEPLPHTGASYYLNGQETVLNFPDVSNIDYLLDFASQSIKYFDGNVYNTGQFRWGYPYGCVWINENIFILPHGSQYSGSRGNSIYPNREAIYIGGYACQYYYGTPAAALWVNDTFVNLEINPNTQTESMILSIMTD